MKEKESIKLKEIYESKMVKRAILTQCHSANCWNPENIWTYHATPCRC
ncbi:MAG: hypothetical protein ACFFDB_13335 [Promethearchaeota archaeon]